MEFARQEYFWLLLAMPLVVGFMGDRGMAPAAHAHPIRQY